MRGFRSTRWRVNGLVVALVSTLVCTAAAGYGTVDRVGWQLASASTGSVSNWPELHQNSYLDGSSTDAAISSSNATTLGINSVQYTGGAILSSPIASYVSSLGENVIFVANDAGNIIAFDQATMIPIWSRQFKAQIRSTPLFENGYLWVAPVMGNTFYKLNAATGAVICSAYVGSSGQAINSTPVLGTPVGGKPTVYIGLGDTSKNGPVVAVDEASCTVDFSSAPQPIAGTGGEWDPLSFVQLNSTTSAVLFGSSDPDSAVYEINAETGALIWRFAAYNPSPYVYDVGAGVVISPPGTNGFADGVAYVESKSSVMYALDLMTGSLIWSYNFSTPSGGNNGSLSTAALSGNDLVFGTHSGLISLNATTGALNWSYSDPSGVDSSPLITGPAGSQVVAYGDFGGEFNVVSLNGGTLLYSFQTGNYITGSPAETPGQLFITSADGFVYSFAPGGANEAPPTTSVTSPATGSSLSNAGSVTSTGSATSTTQDIAVVDVYVQADGSSGQWWDSASGSWVAAPYPNSATLASTNSLTTSWTFKYPVYSSGGTYEVFASAADVNGARDTSAFGATPTGSRTGFSVAPVSGGPTLSTPTNWLIPGSKVAASGTGYSPGETVSLNLEGLTLATALANTSGAISTVMKIPGLTGYGPEVLTAVGATSGDVGSESVYVTDSWLQQGLNPGQTAYSGLDVLFEKTESISANTYMNLAWTYKSSAAIPGSAIEYHGMSFAVSANGLVTSVAVNSGQVAWSVQLAGTPTVSDSPGLTVNGDLIVATASGLLYSINIYNHKIVATGNLGSDIVGSPIVNGRTVYVASSTGLVEAINSSTLQPVWTSNLAVPASGGMTIDPAHGALYVGENSGAVVSLSLSTGVTLWSKSLPSAISGKSMNYGGYLYVVTGSSLYSLNVKTGVIRWSYAAPSAITAGPVLYGSQIVVGTQGGLDEVVAPSTGIVSQTIDEGVQVVGLADANDFIVSTLADGTVRGAKISSSDPAAWRATFSTGATSSASIVNGEVFLTGSGGELTCFVLPGLLPV